MATLIDNRCLIIVDMWSMLREPEATEHPYILSDIDSLAQLISGASKYEQSNRDITVYNLGGGLYTNKKIARIPNIINIESVTELKQHDVYQFCGVHLGRCIDGFAEDLRDHRPDADIQLLTNLCLTYPGDGGYNPGGPFATFYWSYDQIRHITFGKPYND